MQALGSISVPAVPGVVLGIPPGTTRRAFRAFGINTPCSPKLAAEADHLTSSQFVFSQSHGGAEIWYLSANRPGDAILHQGLPEV